MQRCLIDSAQATRSGSVSLHILLPYKWNCYMSSYSPSKATTLRAYHTICKVRERALETIEPYLKHSVNGLTRINRIVLFPLTDEQSPTITVGLIHETSLVQTGTQTDWRRDLPKHRVRHLQQMFFAMDKHCLQKNMKARNAMTGTEPVCKKACNLCQ
jgi:hypothetical protein